MTIIDALQAVFIIAGILLSAEVVASLIVYGRVIRKKEVVPFLEKNLNKYTLNSSAHGMLFGSPLPYIARHYSPLFAYTIKDHGLILRWSKAAKMLDAYFESLPVSKKKGLDQY